MSNTLRVFILLKSIVQVTNDGHRLHLLGSCDVNRCIVMCDAELVVCLNDGLINKLLFLICKIRNENMEECKHLRSLLRQPTLLFKAILLIQIFRDRRYYWTDLHNVDAALWLMLI